MSIKLTHSLPDGASGSSPFPDNCKCCTVIKITRLDGRSEWSRVLFLHGKMLLCLVQHMPLSLTEGLPTGEQ